MKSKANSIFANTYFTTSKIIQDLENIFSKFDKVAKLDTFLYNLKFDMAIANPKEIFNKFFARFTLVIALFDFID